MKILLQVIFVVAWLLAPGTVLVAEESPKPVLDGKRFESVKEHVFGRSPRSRGRQSVVFGNQRWRWRHTDLEESGTYTMDEVGDIVAFGALGGKDIHAHFDRETNNLTWVGEDYTLVRPEERPTQEGNQGGMPQKR